MISNTSIQTIRILKYFSNQTGKKNFKKLKKNMENRRCYSRTEITDESNWFLNMSLFLKSWSLNQEKSQTRTSKI